MRIDQNPLRLDTLALQCKRLVVHHPRRISAAVVVLLAGSAITAFGVAPRQASEAAQRPVQHWVDESVEVPELASQLEALDTQKLTLYQQTLTASSDTADSLLKRLGAQDSQMADFLRHDARAHWVLEGRGKSVWAMLQGQQVQELIVRGPAAGPQADAYFIRLTIQRDGAVLHCDSQQVALTQTVKTGTGVIRSSLFQASDEAGVPDAITSQLAELFASDIDFRRELRQGDAFTVLYTAPLADDQPVTWGVGASHLVAARFVNQGLAHEAVWFQEAGRKGGYYDLQGRSKAKMFLPAPLAYSRVSSGFAMRFHPILHIWTAHKGIDYAAPMGTPVRTIGDGVVEFAGQQRGYGNVIKIRHDAQRETVYAHLSRIGVRPGQHVEQGSIIGNVGATGWATGPHLHFEFKIDEQQVDPVTVARAAQASVLNGLALMHFEQIAQRVREQFALGDSMVRVASIAPGARARVE